ncbi:MAG: phosphoribosylglycinamide formyltransferase [Eubacteriaceae bacterium]
MSLKKIGVLLSGGGSNFQALIDKTHNLYGEIKVVISNNKDAYGLTRGEKAGVDCCYINPEMFANNIEYNRKLIEVLKSHKVDLVVLAGYMKIVTSEFVEAYPNAIVNIHPSLIPSFCGEGFYGLHVHRAVWKSGVKVTGATVHFVNEIPDGGPIILQEVVRVGDNDSPEAIQKKVLEVEHILLPKAVQLFCENKLIVTSGRVKIEE